MIRSRRLGKTKGTFLRVASLTYVYSQAAGLRFIKHWDLLETGLVEFAKDDDFTKAAWDV